MASAPAAAAAADTAAANRADFTVVLLRDSGRRAAEGAAPPSLPPCLPASLPPLPFRARAPSTAVLAAERRSRFADRPRPAVVVAVPRTD